MRLKQSYQPFPCTNVLLDICQVDVKSSFKCDWVKQSPFLTATEKKQSFKTVLYAPFFVPWFQSKIHQKLASWLLEVLILVTWYQILSGGNGLILRNITDQCSGNFEFCYPRYIHIHPSDTDICTLERLLVLPGLTNPFSCCMVMWERANCPKGGLEIHC